MKAFKIAFVIAGLTAGSAFAGDFSFTGNFKSMNEVQPFFFTVTEPSTSITIETLSESGGVNAAGSVIEGGGFLPVITLFDAITGSILTYDLGPSNNLYATLDEGNYIATVTQYSSFNAGFLLSDGFQGTFPFEEFIWGDPHWAHDILNVTSASIGVPYVSPAIPEPQAYAMLLAGLGLLGWRMRSARS